MTYRAAAALQGAVYQRLSTWGGLNGVAVVDAVPPGTGTGTFILLGPEQANDESDGSGAGVAHMFVVSIISDAAGFMAAKAAGAEVSLALCEVPLTLAVGSLVDLTFVRAVVERRLVVANAVDDVLLAGLVGLGLPALSEGPGLRGYEYLLKMRIDRIKASAVAELTAEVATAKAARDALEATSPEQLWATDLDEFSVAWTAYSAWRDALTAETAAESTGAKKVKKAAGVKKATAKKA